MADAQALPGLTDRLALGSSGLEVSPYCLGTVADPNTVSYAFDRGINFFFVSADMHWPNYEATRVGLCDLIARDPAIRDQIVVAAVAYVTQPEFCQVPFEEALAALPGLERLDLLVGGGAYASDFFHRLEIFEEHRREAFLGARAFGFSFHDRGAARLALSRELIDIGFVRYNAGHPGAAKDLFPELPEERSSLLYSFTSTSGYVAVEKFAELGLDADYWRPDITDGYRFALTHARVDGVLCAPTTPAQVDALIASIERGPLDADDEQYLIKLKLLDEGEAELE